MSREHYIFRHVAALPYEWVAVVSAEHAARRAVPAADNLRHYQLCDLHTGAYCSACNAAKAAADMLEAIDALHQPITDHDEELTPSTVCRCCIYDWPCPTHLILHPTEEGL